MFRVKSQSLNTVTCGQHLIAVFFQCLARNFKDRKLVINNQNKLSVSDGHVRLNSCEPFGLRSGGSRNINSELRPLSDFAINVDETVVAFDYGSNSRQAQSCTLTKLLCCEERFEDPI